MFITVLLCCFVTVRRIMYERYHSVFSIARSKCGGSVFYVKSDQGGYNYCSQNVMGITHTFSVYINILNRISTAKRLSINHSLMHFVTHMFFF